MAPRSAASLLLVLMTASLAAAISDKGVIYLDDLTFDKVVNGRDSVLVRFDREYPWGDAHDMFKELAAALGEADAPLVVAGVPISNREEYLVNPRLSRRFSLDKLKDDDLPKFRLFPRGADPRKPLAYAGAATRGALIDWGREHTGVFIGKKGQIEPLDAAAQRLMAAPPGERAAALAKAQEEAGALTLAPLQKEYAEYYIKAMARVVDNGDGWVEKEVQRLARMAGDKAVTAAKREAFEWKVNVLGGFKKPKAGGGGGGGKTEL
ncbi:hypothetical protein Rsub_11571 [Raphidocelis subcapitata]|uniref:Endoplasmic reticulum resident protein 29 C-terminal domain-containing protein n=1 Tax=Raphidocelis subcapitata TaxID=307507 RepID=A0A2V0PP79_9CHLO|nr:hypothetical protein Rsub_11571 [Raphidocelis subcapitata]|eukprot:GBF98985.1 hypothetical protein Rsub_11571 [Raphidocelis subcapitata]